MAAVDNAVVEQFPWITYSDLWTLAGVCAIQEMHGPVIPWRPGRTDRDVSMCTPDGRLPDGAKEQSHLRAIFGRMGFDDREIVALSGAHAIGRCHTDRSGFDGPWSFSPTVLTNDYYRLLLNEKWNFRKVCKYARSETEQPCLVNIAILITHHSGMAPNNTKTWPANP